MLSPGFIWLANDDHFFVTTSGPSGFSIPMKLIRGISDPRKHFDEDVLKSICENIKMWKWIAKYWCGFRPDRWLFWNNILFTKKPPVRSARCRRQDFQVSLYILHWRFYILHFRFYFTFYIEDSTFYIPVLRITVLPFATYQKQFYFPSPLQHKTLRMLIPSNHHPTSINSVLHFLRKF